MWISNLPPLVYDFCIFFLFPQNIVISFVKHICCMPAMLFCDFSSTLPLHFHLSAKTQTEFIVIYGRDSKNILVFIYFGTQKRGNCKVYYKNCIYLPFFPVSNQLLHASGVKEFFVVVLCMTFAHFYSLNRVYKVCQDVCCSQKKSSETLLSIHR